MNVTRSLLDDMKTQQLKWYGHIQRMEDGGLPKQVMKWSPTGRRKRGRPKATRKMEEKDKIIVRWAQEDVETSNNLLNK